MNKFAEMKQAHVDHGHDAFVAVAKACEATDTAIWNVCTDVRCSQVEDETLVKNPFARGSRHIQPLGEVCAAALRTMKRAYPIKCRVHNQHVYACLANLEVHEDA